MPAPQTPLFPWRHPSQSASEAALAGHVSDAAFPCVGAKAALAKGTLAVLACKAVDSAWDDVRIHDALAQFAADYRADPGLYRSLAVVFDGPAEMTEEAFEAALWSRLQSLSDKDVWRGHCYDARVSSDPANPHFSLSFGGEAFFVVGLHPGASRPARRFARPTLVFNLHDQFERLRADGRYETMREKILLRDEALAGTRNPMLARHGEISEARQYSGRPVGEAWDCPFAYHGDAVGIGTTGLLQASGMSGGSGASAAVAVIDGRSGESRPTLGVAVPDNPNPAENEAREGQGSSSATALLHDLAATLVEPVRQDGEAAPPAQGCPFLAGQGIDACGKAAPSDISQRDDDRAATGSQTA